MNIYIAASFAYIDKDKTTSRKQDIERIVSKVKQSLSAYPEVCFSFYIPHQLKIPHAWDLSLEDWAAQVFNHDYQALSSSDLVIFISYGKENNSGSVWECGYAYAKTIPVVVIETTSNPESLMVSNTARAILKESDILTYDFVALPSFKTPLDKIS